jgi:hypothetical protein
MVPMLTACGSESGDESTFAAQNPANNPGGFNGSGNGADGGTSNFDEFAAGAVTKVTLDTACATTSKAAVPTPAYLVFMVDRSWSMTNFGKWPAVNTALKQFFGDARTAGMNASLRFFPDGDEVAMCGADYGTPAVSMQSMPNAIVFGTAIDGVTPMGRTPTVPALKGAVAYAQKVYDEHGKDGKVAIVFVTDGNPDGCESTVGGAGEVVAAVAAKIPTYVIGIGSNLNAMNWVAKKGGTGNALLVAEGDSTGTANGLIETLDKVTRQALSCEFGIPAAPEGQVINPNNVNVQRTPSTGEAVVLPYNSSCDKGFGWRYDNPTTPTKVVLCPTSCGQVTADRRSKIDILYGCATITNTK